MKLIGLLVKDIFKISSGTCWHLEKTWLLVIGNFKATCSSCAHSPSARVEHASSQELAAKACATPSFCGHKCVMKDHTGHVMRVKLQSWDWFAESAPDLQTPLPARVRPARAILLHAVPHVQQQHSARELTPRARLSFQKHLDAQDVMTYFMCREQWA